ncbi:hypothetical protein PQG02_13740 [Nostoc sp. UHCC 0926]|uniref:hypothetical protein n=1 Tax=unclassified Nostoc TaxID=2593658 RepID=UPI002362FECD|nr:hypothetical protein [Nostoc sp. UHCC 0926]WDD35306.1 hypothetical protein PQG02_13740 [Nostoc sp. UHCC 0926]
MKSAVIDAIAIWKQSEAIAYPFFFVANRNFLLQAWQNSKERSHKYREPLASWCKGNIA